MRARLLVALFATAILAAPARSHAPDSGSVPLEGTRVRLQHRTATDIIALFSRATLPDSAHTPRSARAETPESLLPPGVDGILRGDNGEVVLVGAPAKCRELSDLLQRLDEPTSSTQSEVETRFRSSSPSRDVAKAIRALSGGGSVKIEGSVLRLMGSREWLFRALRTGIRVETRPRLLDSDRKL